MHKLIPTLTEAVGVKQARVKRIKAYADWLVVWPAAAEEKMNPKYSIIPETEKGHRYDHVLETAPPIVATYIQETLKRVWHESDGEFPRLSDNAKLKNPPTEDDGKPAAVNTTTGTDKGIAKSTVKETETENAKRKQSGTNQEEEQSEQERNKKNQRVNLPEDNTRKEKSRIMSDDMLAEVEATNDRSTKTEKKKKSTDKDNDSSDESSKDESSDDSNDDSEGKKKKKPKRKNKKKKMTGKNGKHSKKKNKNQKKSKYSSDEDDDSDDESSDSNDSQSQVSDDSSESDSDTSDSENESGSDSSSDESTKSTDKKKKQKSKKTSKKTKSSKKKLATEQIAPSPSTGISQMSGSLPEQMLEMITVQARRDEENQRITSSLVKNLEAKVEEKITGIWKNFSKYKQQAFIWGAASSRKKEPKKLNITCKKFFNNTAAYGIGEIQDILEHVNADGVYGYGHLIILFKNGCLWKRKGEASGLTIAAVLPEGDYVQEIRDKLELAEDNLKWTERYDGQDVQVFRSKTLYAASTYAEMLMQIKTYRVVIGLLFGKGSIIYCELKKMTEHMRNHKENYKNLGSDTNCFYIRVLFRIDILVQKFLDSCTHERKFKKEKFGFLKKELKNMRDAIESHSFSCTLPARYTSKDSRDKLLTKEDMGSSEKSDNKKNYSNTNPKHVSKQETFVRNDVPKKTITDYSRQQNTNYNNNNQNTNRLTVFHSDNTNPNPNWLLPQEFKMAAYLKENYRSNPVPKLRGNAFCMVYHTKGRCRDGDKCAFVHEDPRNVGMGDTFDEYVRKMKEKK